MEIKIIKEITHLTRRISVLENKIDGIIKNNNNLCDHVLVFSHKLEKPITTSISFKSINVYKCEKCGNQFVDSGYYI